MRSLKQLLGWVFTSAAVGLAAALPAHSAAAERWGGLAETVFEHLARDSELPNSTVPTALAEDSEGFLWVGTENGLARWDGYHFRTYKSDPTAAGSLPDNFINTLHADAHGRVWIGTSSGGLARYDRERDRFVTYPAGRGGLSHVSVREIADDGAGGVWLATEGGLDHLAADTDTISHLRHDDSDPGSLPDDRIRTVFRDRDGALWVGTQAGLVRRDVGSQRFIAIQLASDGVRSAAPWTFLQDESGRVWIGTLRHGAFVIQPRQTVARPVLETNTPQPSLQTEGVRSIVEVRPGEIWLGTLGHGIVAVDAATLQTHRIVHDPTLQASLADDTVQALHKDRAGLVWIATDRSISWHDPRQEGTVTVFGASSRRDGVTDDNIDSVLEMPDGKIWLGLSSNGVDVIDPAGCDHCSPRVAQLRPDTQHPASALPKDYVNAFARTESGEVYIGTEQGLYRTDEQLRHVSRVSVPGRDPGSAIWALRLDQGVLWVGGADGLWKTGGEGGRVPGAMAGGKALIGLTDQRITVIEKGPEGSLWVGTKNGLNRVDPATLAIEQILPSPEDPVALAAGYVSALLTDRQGRLWVGTFGGGGINVLETRDSRGHPVFHRIGIDQGLANENINKLLEDAQGAIWASTDDGLARIDPRSFAIRTLRRAEGVAIANYWVGSGAVSRSGELVFGGIGGLTVVRPDKLTLWSYRPPIVVTDVRIGGKRVAVTGINSGESASDAAQPLTIVPSANSIAVEFSALDLSAPERNRYAYKLDGFDPDWVETEPSRRVASYTNLPPGSYALHLRGSNRDGIWTEPDLTVAINVLPAWYQTIVFRTFAVFALVALVGGVVQGRTVYLRRSRRELERQVIARTAELRESQRQLEQIAYYDTLTALPNRRMFMEEFRELLVLTGMQGGRFAVLLIDFDRLKQINDTFGHDAGDALLVEAALRLQSAVRKTDCVARLGGDEFAVLIAHDPAAADIERVCQRVIDSFVPGFVHNGAHAKTTPSIGVAVYPDHGLTHDKLYKCADLALYEAKRTGGNRWSWYRASLAPKTLSN